MLNAVDPAFCADVVAGYFDTPGMRVYQRVRGRHFLLPKCIIISVGRLLIWITCIVLRIAKTDRSCRTVVRITITTMVSIASCSADDAMSLLRHTIFADSWRLSAVTAGGRSRCRERCRSGQNWSPSQRNAY